jgi:hypothetical protein
MWKNIKYFLYTLITLAVGIPVLLGLWWSIQVVVVIIIGGLVFVVYKILDTEQIKKS